MDITLKVKFGQFSYCNFKNTWAITRNHNHYKRVLEITFNNDDYNFVDINIESHQFKTKIYSGCKIYIPLNYVDEITFTFYVAKYPCLFILFPYYSKSHTQKFQIPKKEILGSDECNICFEKCKEDEYISFCKHVYHTECIIQYLEKCKNLLECECNNICTKKFDCPVCRSIIN